MDTAKRMFFFLFILGLARGGVFAGEDGAGAEGPLWRMAVLKKNESAYDSVPFSRPLTMTRRDAFQLYLDFDGPGYCYVVQEDDEGKLPLVFRKEFYAGDRITLPEGGGDFRAAELAGTSRLYVIVSARPRQNLERLIDLYGTEAAPVSLERSILSEVLAARKGVSSLDDTEAAPPPETGRAIKGESRLFPGRDTWVVTVTVRS